MTTDFEPVIIAFCCHYCAYTAADMAGSQRISYPPNVQIIRVPCSGKVDIIHILKAFENGADGVYVAGCLSGDCHFKTGNIKAARHV
ncbi:MAG: hydrogenase iron-sulfur subunit, partial [Desulfatirhabdiaceae bacterium]